MVSVPKKIWHVWIGPKPAPKQWMKSWPEKHPDWDYQIIDNEYLSNHTFHNQHLIDQYMLMPDKHGYAGAADLIRYEILYEHGGIMPGADSICLENTDELWDQPYDYCYSVYENETIRPGYIAPVYASNPKNKFLEFIIEDLHKLSSDRLYDKAVYEITGNKYLKTIVEANSFSIKIFPSYYFIPQHFFPEAVRYSGPGKIYADQMWGSTKKIYEQGI